MTLSDLISRNQSQLIEAWNRELLANPTKGLGRISDAELRKQTNSLLQLIDVLLESNADVSSSAWLRPRELLEEISRSRVLQGFDSAETASFIFSLKKPCSRWCSSRVEAMRANLLSDLAGFLAHRRTGPAYG